MYADAFLLLSLFIFCDFYTRYCLSWTHVLVLLPEGSILAALAECMRSQRFILVKKKISGECFQTQSSMRVDSYGEI